MSEKRQGIKRHEALHPLSHHHTQALFIALKLKQVGTEKSKFSIGEVKQDVQDFWETEGNEHFREEEEILLTAFAQYASIERPEIEEMLLEHVKIRAQMDTLLQKEEIDISLMNDLGVLLESHIRKEERIIFPMIEEALPEEKLQELKFYLHINNEE